MAAGIVQVDRERADEAYALLDEVFIQRGNRWPSFRERYPVITEDDGDTAGFAAFHDHRLASVAYVKTRDWRAATGERIRIGMIGGVCTNPAYRGLGLASQTVAAAEEWAHSAGCARLVLWTGISPFYERLGWRASDEGFLGRFQGLHIRASISTVTAAEPPSVADQIEAIRRASAVEGIARKISDYRCIPLPAERTLAFLACEKAHRAYLLAGERGEACFVYECEGDTDCYQALFQALEDRYASVFINATAGRLKQWICQQARVDWEEKRLAMWKGPTGPYIPYFDRI